MLVVTKLDHLARLVTDLMAIIQKLDAKAVGLRILGGNVLCDPVS